MTAWFDLSALERLRVAGIVSQRRMMCPAGEKAVTACYLWDTGVTMGFGIDTTIVRSLDAEQSSDRTGEAEDRRAP